MRVVPNLPTPAIRSWQYHIHHVGQVPRIGYSNENYDIFQEFRTIIFIQYIEEFAQRINKLNLNSKTDILVQI